MIHFIYGEDSFRSKEALKKIEADFILAQGEINVEKIDGENIKAGQLESKASTLSFFGEKRLVIVNNFLTSGKKEEKEQMLAGIKRVIDSQIADIVFYEDSLPDRREAIFKYLDKLPAKQVFSQLDDFGLKKWIMDRASQQKFEISNSACARLIAYVGADIYRLQNEISRLIDFAKSADKGQIEEADIVNLIEPNNNYKIFDLTDAISQKNIKKAMIVLSAFRKSGEDNYRIFNLIIHQIRTMITVNDFSKQISADQIAKEAGIHPFVVKKTLASIRNFSTEELFRMYSRLEEVDWKAKTGMADIAVMTEMLIVEICRKC